MNSMAAGTLASSPIGHFFASINPVVLMLTLISPGSDSFITECNESGFTDLGRIYDFLYLYNDFVDCYCSEKITCKYEAY